MSTTETFISKYLLGNKLFAFILVSSSLLLTACAVNPPAIEQKPEKRVSKPGHYVGYSLPKYQEIEKTSFYVTMSDGVKIAVDLALPKNLKPGERLPAILDQTRYVRSVEYSWPFSIGQDRTSVTNATQAFFVRHGYAYLKVDVRGSGASFGIRPYPWSPKETSDGAEIVDWIIKQPWSNGKIGTYGTSYTGTTAEFLLVNKHPSVLAAAIRFSLFDAYDDIAFPGGIHSKWFTKAWGHFNGILDRNQWSEFGFFPSLAVKGVNPVDTDLDHILLNQASKQHLKNYDVHQEALGITYRDDISPSKFGTVDDFSPFKYTQQIRESGAHIYSYGGWFDCGYVHSVIKRYLTLKDTQRIRLLIGPWDHGGGRQISYWSKSRKPKFNRNQEILRFFDYYIKGTKNGFGDEKPVRYYTMGEEKWKWADDWPLENQQKVRFYFSTGKRLSVNKPVETVSVDTYQVDYSTGTGQTTRWHSALNLDGNFIEYPNRKEADRKLLVYNSPPLEADMEVTGHPVVRLYVSSTESDGHFFVYLEDITPQGEVVYVTEGQLRALHRKISGEKRPYADVVPYHSYLRKDGQLMKKGEIAELIFDLLPTSYLFKKGHSIRIAVAGADKDLFPLMKSDPPPILTIHRNEKFASAIDLPVIPR